MTSAEVVTAIGRAMREAGRGTASTSEFSRGQLMSAYSASRHLSVELADFPAELHGFSMLVAGELAGELAGAADLAQGDRLLALGEQIRQTSAPGEVGNLVSAALDVLSQDASTDSATLRARLQSALRALADREVELLAAVIEGPAPP